MMDYNKLVNLYTDHLHSELLEAGCSAFGVWISMPEIWTRDGQIERRITFELEDLYEITFRIPPENEFDLNDSLTNPHRFFAQASKRIKNDPILRALINQRRRERERTTAQ